MAVAKPALGHVPGALEKIVMFGDVYAERTVLVTGHTGFKGAWLSIWLLTLGAKVVGYSLEPPTDLNLFESAGLAARLTHIHGDVRDRQHIQAVIDKHRPDYIFHLAAQPLVLNSYSEPFETFEINVMGTLALLEGLRGMSRPCTAVIVSTDKCYENREWDYGYREIDALGGHDPYSASKAAMEIALASYQRSFFVEEPSAAAVRIASARAGNVIGGGDWSENRIVPDVIRALASRRTVGVRSPDAVRPWQHVLEPLSGYLWLASNLSQSGGQAFVGPWNFGPNPIFAATVRDLVETAIQAWGFGEWQDVSEADVRPHEAQRLSLSIDQAQRRLGWQPVWGFDDTVEYTIAHYKQLLHMKDNDEAIFESCTTMIDHFVRRGQTMRLPWAL